MNEYFGANKSDFTDSEWNLMVKKAFGKSLVNKNYEIRSADDCKIILNDTRRRLQDSIYDIQEQEYIFGCHFCNIPDLRPLSIGPVLFEPRLAWLRRMHRQGSVSTISLSRVERTWQGERLDERKDPEDGIGEREIHNAIGECDFVCSVKIAACGTEAGLQKAITAARLATTAIALAWDRPSSVLDSMALTFDRQPYRQENMVLFPNGHFGWQSSWSYLPGGVTWMRRENWEGLVADLDNIFNCAGEVISHVTKIAKSRCRDRRC